MMSVRMRKDRKQKIVRGRDTRWGRDLFVTLGTILILAAPFAVYILKSAENMDYGFKVEESRSQKEKLLEENRALKLERARLMSPERVEEVARNELQLEPAPMQDFYLVEKNPGKAESESLQIAMYRSISKQDLEGQKETSSP